MKKIEFTSYPLMAYPFRGFFSLAIIILITTLSYVFVKHIAMPIFAFMIICMPLVNFLFPSKYIFEDESFKKMQLFQEKKIDWDMFSNFTVLNDGVLLMCDTNRKKNEYVYIFDKDRYEEIEEFLNIKGIKKYASR